MNRCGRHRGGTRGVAGVPAWVLDTKEETGGTVRRDAVEEGSEPCGRLVSPGIAGDEGVASGCGMERSEQSVVCGWRVRGCSGTLGV